MSLQLREYTPGCSRGSSGFPTVQQLVGGESGMLMENGGGRGKERYKDWRGKDEITNISATGENISAAWYEARGHARSRLPAWLEQPHL